VTLVASALLLSEQVGWIEIVFALAVVASVMAGRWTQVGLKTPVAARSGPRGLRKREAGELQQQSLSRPSRHKPG
jgi:hypothetical protein